MRRWGGRPAQRMVALTLATYGRTCHLCGLLGATTADHLLPRSKGGTDVLANLRPAHHSCNSRRGDMALDAWFARYPLGGGQRATPSRDWLGSPDNALTCINAPNSSENASDLGFLSAETPSEAPRRPFFPEAPHPGGRYIQPETRWYSTGKGRNDGTT